MKWSGFRPPLCTYMLNWARKISWGCWDEWDDTVLQTQDSKFEPWRSEAEHATSRSRRLPTIPSFTRGWGRNIFVSSKPARQGTEPRTLACKAAVLTTTLEPPPRQYWGNFVVLVLVLAHVYVNVDEQHIFKISTQVNTKVVQALLECREQHYIIRPVTAPSPGQNNHHRPWYKNLYYIWLILFMLFKGGLCA